MNKKKKKKSPESLLCNCTWKVGTQNELTWTLSEEHLFEHDLGIYGQLILNSDRKSVFQKQNF